MHIPDNYLSPSTCAVFTAAMLPIWKKTVDKIKKEITKKKLPLLGISAAFSFLIMMFNVPLPGGTTGHAVGGTLIAILIGPYAACLSVTIALLIQALLFGDGGILAFGVNSFNMAFILPFTGYYIYRLLNKIIKGDKKEYISSFIAAYIALNIAALITAIEFGIQPILFKDSAGLPLYCPYPISVSVPSMLIPHMLTAGFVEAFVTAGVLGFIKKASPEILYENSYSSKNKPMILLLGAMIILTPLGLLAQGTAWGEWGIDEISEIVTGGSMLGYTPFGMENGLDFRALMPDYSIVGLPETFGYILSALAGCAIILIIFKLIYAIKYKDIA